jgi:hypothetical protein
LQVLCEYRLGFLDVGLDDFVFGSLRVSAYPGLELVDGVGQVDGRWSTFFEIVEP